MVLLDEARPEVNVELLIMATSEELRLPLIEDMLMLLPEAAGVCVPEEALEVIVNETELPLSKEKDILPPVAVELTTMEALVGLSKDLGIVTKVSAVSELDPAPNVVEEVVLGLQ